MKHSGIVSIIISITCCCTTAFARNWTDQQGNTLQADFVRMHNGSAVLKKKAGGTILSVPFYNLSDADQEFLRNELTAKNQAHLTPPPPVLVRPPEATPAVGNPAVGNPAVTPGTPPIGVQPIIPRPPQIPHAPTHPPRTPPPAPSIRPTPEPVRPPIPTPQLPPSTVVIPPPPPPPPVRLPSPRDNSPLAASYFCSNCKKEVPASIPAGGSCPHCRVRFDYVENPNGTRTYSPGSGGSFGGFRLGRAIVAICVLLGTIGGWIARWGKKS